MEPRPQLVGVTKRVSLNWDKVSLDAQREFLGFLSWYSFEPATKLPSTFTDLMRELMDRGLIESDFLFSPLIRYLETLLPVFSKQACALFEVDKVPYAIVFHPTRARCIMLSDLFYAGYDGGRWSRYQQRRGVANRLCSFGISIFRSRMQGWQTVDDPLAHLKEVGFECRSVMEGEEWCPPISWPA